MEPGLRLNREKSDEWQLVFDGDVSLLASRRAHFRYNDSAGTSDHEGFRVFTTEPNGGEKIPEGHLCFDLEKLTAFLTDAHLLEGTERAGLIWPRAEFRTVRAGEELVDEYDQPPKEYASSELAQLIFGRHMYRSKTGGALAVRAYAQSVDSDGRQWIIPPGRIDPTVQLVVSYGYVFAAGWNAMITDKNRNQSLAVLGDIKRMETGTDEAITIHGDSISKYTSVKTRRGIAEVRPWALEHFDVTFQSMVTDERVREAAERYGRIMDEVRTDRVPLFDYRRALQQPAPDTSKGIPYERNDVWVAWAHQYYKPALERARAAMHATPNRAQVMRLI